METISNTPTKQVTVDVPEERMAEFHAFFARFLSGRRGRGRGGPPGRHHHGGGPGRHCRGERGPAREEQAATQPADTTEV